LDNHQTKYLLAQVGTIRYSLTELQVVGKKILDDEGIQVFLYEPIITHYAYNDGGMDEFTQSNYGWAIRPKLVSYRLYW
jgi:hypothetical protein